MCCKSLAGSTCGTTIMAIPCEEDVVTTGTWTPAFSGNYASSFYTAQSGSYVKQEKQLHVNFQIIVSSYVGGGPNPSVMTIPLPFMTSAALTNNQFVNLCAYQGVGAAEFTPLPVFGIIGPGSQTLSIYPNFTIANGDQWVGNFTIVLA